MCISDLPHKEWNRSETLTQLEELLPNMLLPEPDPQQSDSWHAANQEVIQYIATVVESGEGNKVELYSR